MQKHIDWTQQLPFKERQRCIFCASDHFKFLLAYDDLKVFRCPCGYVFMNPYLSEEGSRIIFSDRPDKHFPWLKDYESALDDENSRHPLIFRAYQEVLQTLEGYLPEPRRILDVGCGGAHFLNTAKARGWKVNGVDFSQMKAAQAEEKFGIKIHEGRIDNAPFGPDSFDAITMWDYFEHVENPVQILRAIKTLLKPNGILVIACPNHKSLLFGLALFLYRVFGDHFVNPLRLLYPPTHLSYFEPAFVERLAAKEGFEPLRVDYDETDLNRIQLNLISKILVRLLFWIARPLHLSNRFIIYAKKGSR